eukprot:GHVL01034576.1.p1 GENE.GHVL01034576.1~~GHVL01034576.1.p1  ORF type:complete len:102 (+),score=18.28 GHVL01034576.1:594-899(+)
MGATWKIPKTGKSWGPAFLVFKMPKKPLLEQKHRQPMKPKTGCRHVAGRGAPMQICGTSTSQQAPANKHQPTRNSTECHCHVQTESVQTVPPQPQRQGRTL